MQSYEQAYAYIAALTDQPPEHVRVSFRMLHDRDKSVEGIKLDGTLPELWQAFVYYQSQGYGVFVNINEFDGAGHLLTNVRAIRAQAVDLDGIDAPQQYQAAAAWTHAPTFAVESSPQRYHAYWTVNPYTGNDYYTALQRKLRQLFNGDKTIVDPTRVLRLPGTLNLKRDIPHLVHAWGLSGIRYDVQTLAAATQHVNVIDGGHGGRHDLGDPTLAAPSLDMIRQCLDLLDPNTLDRGEWIAITAGIKQSIWSLTDPDTAFRIWSDWCARYAANDHGENLKQWNSIRNSELGWQSLRRRIPALTAVTLFGSAEERQAAAQDTPTTAAPATPGATVPPMPNPEPAANGFASEYVDIFEQQEWFKDCVFITNMGEILARDGRYLNSGQFNASYGGKKFLVSSDKTTDEAWKAATRCTLWQIPKVDHTRFLPDTAHRAVITDDMGRKGINVYRPALIRRVSGDYTPFLRHIAALLPDQGDQHILLSYMAHNARFPGHKIPWAPVIQSAEGAGKGVIKAVMKHVMGRSYIYFPKASELAESGAKFNAWLRNKLFILVDEIKVDERRELIEVLKPLISEEETEIQAKGHDQDIEDNFSNWLFFTNWKDAIPINKNARRFAIMYSPLQSLADMIALGLNEAYFNALYTWLKADGGAIVADYLLNYPIERGALPMRAPNTSSTAEVIELSRSPIERAIIEAVSEGVQGFRGGWISVTSVVKRLKAQQVTRTAVAPQTVQTVLEGMGYVACGRAPRAFYQEDREIRPYLYHYGTAGDPGAFGRLQGWE